MKKALLMAAALTTVGVAGLAGVNSAAASTTGNSLVDKLATTFDLEVSEVQTVLDEHKTERKAEFAEKRLEELQTKVDEGVITQAQLELLQARVEEMKTLRQELHTQDLTREEMHERMEAERESFKDWAEENLIDIEAIRPDHSGRRGHGRGHFKNMEGTEQSELSNVQ